MNVSAIKKLVENASLDQLKASEEALLNEQPLPVDVDGEDEGEKLTHVLAAIFCKETMEKEGININQAVRLYSQRVRDSIN